MSGVSSVSAEQAPSEETPPDLELARRLVADQFPQWADLPVRQVELSGWDNRTYRLGDELSIRLPRSHFYCEQVAKEQRWLPVLAPRLPAPIPQPVGRGVPGLGYPYDWSLYRWLKGSPARLDLIPDPVSFARAIGEFLVALRACDATGGPLPGQHNWWRGAPFEVYAEEARTALTTLSELGELSLAETRSAAAILAEAVASIWPGPPVWFHGDVAYGNLLVRDGRLAAVIDFGCSGVGDPACDLVLAWTLLPSAARTAYAHALGLDHDTWARGRGWCLWKALITVVGSRENDPAAAEEARRVIREVLTDPVH